MLDVTAAAFTGTCTCVANKLWSDQFGQADAEADAKSAELSRVVDRDDAVGGQAGEALQAGQVPDALVVQPLQSKEQTLCKKLPKTWEGIDTWQALRVSSELLQVKLWQMESRFRQQVLEDAGAFAEGCWRV